MRCLFQTTSKAWGIYVEGEAERLLRKLEMMDDSIFIKLLPSRLRDLRRRGGRKAVESYK